MASKKRPRPEGTESRESTRNINTGSNNNGNSNVTLPVPARPSSIQLPGWANGLAWEPSACARLAHAVPDCVNTKAHARFFATGMSGSFTPLTTSQLLAEARKLSLAEWDTLASQDVPEHTGEACRQQWFNALAPDLINGRSATVADSEVNRKTSENGRATAVPFSEIELAALKVAVDKYQARNWTEIARDVNEAGRHDISQDVGNNDVGHDDDGDDDDDDDDGDYPNRTSFRCYTEWKQINTQTGGINKKLKITSSPWSVLEDQTLRNAINW
jgi:hypothetical protein